MALTPGDIQGLFRRHGHIAYAGEGVTQLEHALQAAGLAEKEGASPELVTAAFLCAAAFIFVLQKYGPVEACLVGAAFFFVVTLILACLYIIRKNQIRAQAAAAAKAAAQSPLADPMLAALALQVIRAVGVKKVIPLLAIGGLALGLMAGRSTTRTSRDDDAK